MDEMAYSIDGENAHYGTPPNPAAPGRIPGGSTSGSAVRSRFLQSASEAICYDLDMIDLMHVLKQEPSSC